MLTPMEIDAAGPVGGAASGREIDLVGGDRAGRPAQWWQAWRRQPRPAEPGDAAAMVRRARDGDAAAFTALVRAHQDRIYRLALRMTGPDAAEDVAQQAFLKAWRGLARFGGGATFGTWLYRIAINECLDHLRRAHRFRPLPLDESLHATNHDDPAEAVIAAVEQEARRAALAWALEQIATEDRLLVHLRVDEGRSYDEIAALLEMNPRTVGTRLFRVRARLHALIARRLGEGGYDLH